MFLRMAFRGRKLFSALDNRAPGRKEQKLVRGRQSLKVGNQTEQERDKR